MCCILSMLITYLSLPLIFYILVCFFFLSLGFRRVHAFVLVLRTLALKSCTKRIKIKENNSTLLKKSLIILQHYQNWDSEPWARSLCTGTLWSLRSSCHLCIDTLWNRFRRRTPGQTEPCSNRLWAISLRTRRRSCSIWTEKRKKIGYSVIQSILVVSVELTILFSIGQFSLKDQKRIGSKNHKYNLICDVSKE